jgi:lichenan operon transcriptional antiterminator
VTRAKQDRLLGLLLRDGGWVTAATLADQLGVTARSVRSYVTSVNGRVSGGQAVESGPQGYRAGVEAGAALQTSPGDGGSPRDRLHTLVTRLLDAPDGLDVYAVADEMFVSAATVESDLARVRSLLGGTELILDRQGAQVRLRGTEMAQRRLLSRLVHDEMDAGAYDTAALRRALGEQSAVLPSLAPFKAALVAQLVDFGYYVNEYGMSDVLTHVAIAADRVARQRGLDAEGLPEPVAAQLRVANAIETLAREHLGVDLGPADSRHLASVVLTRVVAPGIADETRAPLDPEVEGAVREAVGAAASEFLVEIHDEDFVLRLALHVQNLRLRARDKAWSRNPLTRSLKSTYPMIFEVAVFIASELSQRLNIPLHDDEIAYIAMHVGGQLERSRRSDERLTATIICPGYYELHELLRSSVARSLGQSIEVVRVETRVDPDWADIDTDLVLTTIDAPPGAPVPPERVVRIQPFLTPADVDRIQVVAVRARRTRRLAKLRTELERYFRPDAFVHGIDPTLGEEGTIRLLGGLLRDAGVIDDAYLERAVAREGMSSTAFTDALAVPHAIGMTAAHTAIAVGIADPSIPWGDARVQVVALVAFSENDRAAFQTVFEQFVEVFNERESAQRIVRRATSLPSFLDELVAVIDG